VRLGGIIAYRWAVLASPLLVLGCGKSTRSGETEGADPVDMSPELHLIEPTPAQLERGAAARSMRVDVAIDFVSDDGTAAVGTSDAIFDDEQGPSSYMPAVFHWTKETGTVAIESGVGPDGTIESPPLVAAMTPDGSVVVGGTDYGRDTARAFRWTEAPGMLDLSPAGAMRSVATLVSDDGNVVAGHFDAPIVEGEPEVEQAFVWTPATGSVPLGALPGDLGAIPYSMSADGSVIAGLSLTVVGEDEGRRGVLFRWTEASGMTAIETLPGCEHFEVTRSSATFIAGTCRESAVSLDGQSFVWTDEMGLMALGNPPGTDGSTPFAVSLDGSIAVGIASLDRVGAGVFRWARGGASEALSYPGADSTDIVYRRTMSDDGQVVVGHASNDGTVPVSFRWTPDSGATLLEPLPEASDAFVSGVSGDGLTIFGWNHLDGETIHVVWTPASPTRLTDVLARHRVRTPDIARFLHLESAKSGRILYGTARLEQGRDYGFLVELPLPP
jgi:uncharacterized membrane protein